MNKEFALQRINYIIIASGFAVIILSFILMAGGGSDNPAEFNPEIFSFRRITLAPTLALAGYVAIMYGIMKKPSAVK